MPVGDVPGVGEARREALRDQGIHNASDLAGQNSEDLAQVVDIPEGTLRNLIGNAEESSSDPSSEETGDTLHGQGEVPDESPDGSETEHGYSTVDSDREDDDRSDTQPGTGG
ncbi:MAG: helix-hairpin-helix domain-containing protein [Candidatus Magasanikbacteria bacterium]